MPYQTKANLIDELGVIKAQISELEQEKAAVEAKLRRLVFGGCSAEGELFRVARIVQQNKRVDWKAIAEKFNPSHQLVAAHTHAGNDKDYFKVTARKAEKAA